MQLIQELYNNSAVNIIFLLLTFIFQPLRIMIFSHLLFDILLLIKFYLKMMIHSWFNKSNPKWKILIFKKLAINVFGIYNLLYKESYSRWE